MNVLKNILAGVVIGVANIIPGVSGGTMAVIMGIYDKLISAISLNLHKLKKNFFFLFTIGFGAFSGIFLFSKLLTYLFENYEVPTYFFFIGLILGSIPFILNKITEDRKFKTINILPFLITFGIMIMITFLPESENVVTSELTINLAVKLFLAGAIAAIAMILPGISGSFLLMSMGQYETITAAISELNLPILIPVSFGVATGIFAGAKLISLLLKKFKQGVYSAILGLVIGSVFQIFPNNFALNMQGYIAIFALIFGILIPIIMEKITANS